MVDIRGSNPQHVAQPQPASIWAECGQGFWTYFADITRHHVCDFRINNAISAKDVSNLNLDSDSKAINTFAREFAMKNGTSIASETYNNLSKVVGPNKATCCLALAWFLH